MNSTLENHSKASAVCKNPCLKSLLEQLYEQRHETGDIKFVIDAEQIPAHRYILAALSPKYKAQFYGPMSEKDVIHVEDVSPAAFNEFLQFFYLDDVTLTVENIEDVLNLAKQSLVDELLNECTRFLINAIGMDKLVWCYRLAIDYEIKPLEEFCVKQIGGNIKSVFQTNDFLSCDQKMLCQILEIDSLNCTENDIFDGCISWAHAKCIKDGVDDSNLMNLRGALSDAIFKIRFCSMTSEQFATIDEKHFGFLSAQETIEIYRTIALKRTSPISKIFKDKNGTPRKPINLECSFGTGSPLYVSTPVSYDIIKFYCDTNILLNGFVACNRIEGDIIVEVQISDVPQSFHHTKVVSVLDDKTEIRFNEPIHLAANHWCNLKITSSTFQEISMGWYGFNVKSRVKQNGVTFEFAQYLWNDLNLITCVLFNAIDNS